MGKLYAICLLLLMCVSCEGSFEVDISIEDSHPWERASGRQFWYTLVYQGTDGLEMVNLPIGTRRARVAVPRLGTVVFAAYPLGAGIPMVAHCLSEKQRKSIVLSADLGPLCDSLLHIAKTWPLPVTHVNVSRLAARVREIAPDGMGVDWNRLATDIVSGTLGRDSVTKLGGRALVLGDVPGGRWVCEAGSFGSLTIFDGEEVSLDSVPPGVLRFVNLARKMELRLMVSEEPGEMPFFHLAPVDTLLAISDPAYHDLVGRAHDFP